MGLNKILFNFSDQLNHEGIWCSNKGPGTKYSSANHMFLYFKTDDDIGLRGFEFVVSGIRKEKFCISYYISYYHYSE